MATLAQLEALGSLIKHEADLESWEMPERFVYHAPTLTLWLTSILRSLPKDRSRDLSPYEQVEQALYDFVTKKPMRYGQDDRKLDPLTYHVWELKTEDVRLIGWFPCRATFIIVRGEMRKNLKPFKLYAPLIQDTIVFRNGLDLDEPKMLIGVTHNDVL